MSAPKLLTIEDVDRVRMIGLQRPDVHNAFNHDLVRELMHAVRRRPETTTCVVLFGHGASFCAGGDRREGIAAPDGETLETLETLQNITRELQRPDVVSIAAVEGWAIGGGAELALACDLIVAAQGATFRFPEIELDTHVTGGASWLLPRAIGLSRAKLLLLTGSPVEAATAAAWGLVAEVTPDGECLDRARDLAAQIAKFEPGTLAAMKRSLDRGWHGTLESSLAIEVLEAHPRLGPGGFRGTTD